MIALAVVFAACTRSEAPRAEKVAQAPPRYVMSAGPYGPQLTMRTTLRAPADRPLYVINCNGAMTHGLQRLENGTWTNAWIAEINGCYSPPIVIPPGGRHTALMTVVSRPETWTITPGTYRAVWHNVLLSVEPHQELSLEQRVSAPFVIVGAAGQPATRRHLDRMKSSKLTASGTTSPKS